VTRRQSVAARGLLDWSQKQASDLIGVAQSTLADFERGHRQSHTIDRMRDGYVAAGIEFIGRNGVIYHER
jgi:transcriptional regulator with XRE-family HTH domain